MKFPSVPSTLKHKAFWTRDALSYARELPPLRTGGQSAPYLGLKSRLSQVWLNRWTVLLLLVLVRVILLLSSLNDNIGDAKVKALSACTKVEDIGSAMASMPHYLSVGVNRVASEGIEAAVSGVVQVLMMLLTAVENIIYFVINFYVGTYVCLIAAFIHGTFDMGIGAADGAARIMNSAITQITSGLASSAAAIQNEINRVIDVINKATPAGGIFGGGSGLGLSPVNIGIDGAIRDLQNIKVDPTEFVKTLSALKDKTPTFDDVQDLAKKAIAVPFDLVRKELNASSATWGMPVNVFPVAQKQALSFCSDNTAINDFFGGLYNIANNAKIAFLVVIPILAVLVCIPMARIEIRRYREQKALARQMTNAEYDAMDVIYQASRPKSSRIGLWLGRRFKGTNREYIARWGWAYCTSLPALFVLSLAIAGLFSCFCQWIVLMIVQKEAPALVNRVGDFAQDVVQTLSGVSEKWALDANGAIIKMNNDVNDDMLGKVRIATSAVNNTLATFTDEMNKRLDSVFAGTVLHDTVKNVVRCLIGIKIEAVQSGMQWVHEHARVTFPLFPKDIFSAGAAESVGADSSLTSFLASPSSVTTDEITAAVNHVIDFLRNGLIQDALISTGLLLVYVILVLVGVIRALLNISGPRSTRGDGAGLRGKKISGPNPFDDPAGAKGSHHGSSTKDSNSYEMPNYGHHRGGAGYANEKREFYGDEDEERQLPPASTYNQDNKKHRHFGR